MVGNIQRLVGQGQTRADLGETTVVSSLSCASPSQVHRKSPPMAKTFAYEDNSEALLLTRKFQALQHLSVQHRAALPLLFQLQKTGSI